MKRQAVCVELTAFPGDFPGFFQPAAYGIRCDQAISNSGAFRFQSFRCFKRTYRFVRSVKEDEIPPDEHVRYPKVTLNLQCFTTLSDARVILAHAKEDFSAVIHKSRNERFQLVSSLINRQGLLETALRPQHPPAVWVQAVGRNRVRRQ